MVDDPPAVTVTVDGLPATVLYGPAVAGVALANEALTVATSGKWFDGVNVNVAVPPDPVDTLEPERLPG